MKVLLLTIPPEADGKSGEVSGESCNTVSLWSSRNVTRLSCSMKTGWAYNYWIYPLRCNRAGRTHAAVEESRFRLKMFWTSLINFLTFPLTSTCFSRVYSVMKFTLSKKKEAQILLLLSALSFQVTQPCQNCSLLCIFWISVLQNYNSAFYRCTNWSVWKPLKSLC